MISEKRIEKIKANIEKIIGNLQSSALTRQIRVNSFPPLISKHSLIEELFRI